MKRSFALLAFLAAPAWAIVITTGDPNSSVYTVGYQEVVGGVNLSGVVKVTSSRGACTGSLLGDGYSILTSAHCVTSAYGSSLATGITASFKASSGFVPISVDLTFIDPAYTGDATLGGDLAVLRLNGAAPSWASRYSLFSGGMPTNPLVIAGYGLSGVGATGATLAYGTLRAGTNQYVTTGAEFGWSGNLLMGQFYDASRASSNALNAANPYSASDQVMIASGDSGGPSFYAGSIVGVHDLLVCISPENNDNICAVPPSITASLNSSFGQIFADVSVSAKRDWIEAQMLPEPGTFLLFAPPLVFLCRRKRLSRR